MKLGIAISAALAIAACSRIAVAGEIDKAIVVKVADQGVVVPAPRVHRRHYVVQPLACEAVLFPRSPLCAGRPASYGYYAPYPWNLYWSY